MAKYIVDTKKYAVVAREAAAEGIVLLKNEKQVLPLAKGSKVAVFGRIMFDYYKSGTGSGGMVHTRYVTGILDALQACEELTINEKVIAEYRDWLKDHPFDQGVGWAAEPWCQEEMPVSDSLVKTAAEESETAIVVIGRSAGEDRDNQAEKGSYYLTDAEYELLQKVSSAFEKVIVLLNTGNIMDMNWMDTICPQAVLYVWQGGQEGGNAVVDILMGKQNPSGKLTDTVAYEIKDYPSDTNFGCEDKIIYAEDIFVGYRYFETFAKDRVRYPFGYGLSYSTFSVKFLEKDEQKSGIAIKAEVKNTGGAAGKEVVQIYVEKPQGKLGAPARELVAYGKTKLLAPGETQCLEFFVPNERMSSYDDKGMTAYPYAYVMEAGTYHFYLGTDVRGAEAVCALEIAETMCIEQCRQALAPVDAFERLCRQGGQAVYEAVPLRGYSIAERMEKERPTAAEFTGDKGYKLSDVLDQKISMDTFLAQLTEEELSWMVKGEGMSSPKVTPGTGGAYGGLTDRLLELGIPATCCSDGPSGIRMDCGTYAFSLPNGTCLASTFNRELNEELFAMEGLELRKNRIESLLGPGINIHRHPLNGRNFEYFSEDPYLTGTMAASQLNGLHRWQVTGTIKHFACNNQEHRRRFVNSVVSERAVREIYLKGFEIAVKEGGADSIMSSYGALNGIWTAGNYDLLTSILRKEWGFTGIVMTDWWAEVNEEGGKQSVHNLAEMVRAQNDVYMVVKDTVTYECNIKEALASRKLTRAELVRAAVNVCRNICGLAVMPRFLDRITEEEREDVAAQAKQDEMFFDLPMQNIIENPELDLAILATEAGKTTLYGITNPDFGKYTLRIKLRSFSGKLAQIPLTISLDGKILAMITINGTDGEWIEESCEMMLFGNNHYLKFYFGQSGMEIDSIRVELSELMNPQFE